MIMDKELSVGTRFLNGFLRIMVIVLIGVLAAVVITMILALVGLV